MILLIVWIGVIYLILLAFYHLPRKKKFVEENLDKDLKEIEAQSKEIFNDLANMLLKCAIFTLIYTIIMKTILTIFIGDKLSNVILFILIPIVFYSLSYAIDKKKIIRYFYGTFVFATALLIAIIAVYGINYLDVRVINEKSIKNIYSVENRYRFYIDNYSAFNDLKVNIEVLEERYKILTPKTNFIIKPREHKKVTLTVIARRVKGIRKKKITFKINNNFTDPLIRRSIFWY